MTWNKRLAVMRKTSMFRFYKQLKSVRDILLWVFAHPLPDPCHIVHGLNSLRPRQNGHHFADDTCKRNYLNENVWISIDISLKFVPKVPINNILALVQIMAWRRPGDKPLSEPMMVNLPTHICVTRPQWVKSSFMNRAHLRDYYYKCNQ